MLHFSGNTSGVSKSLSDWLRISGRRVSRSLTLRANKDAVAPNSLTKEERRRVYKCDAYRSRLNAGFPKVCEIFKVVPQNI